MRRQSGLKHLAVVSTPLLLMMALILFPFYWTFVISIKPQDESYEAMVTYRPGHITFEVYSKLFITTVSFFVAMENNLIVASLTTTVLLAASTLAAYAFSRHQFTGRKILMCMLLCDSMFPMALLLIPLYTVMRKTGPLYTPASLVLSYTTFTIPFSIWLLLGFLNGLPMSFEEATLTDGYNRGSTSLKIILPILSPRLMAIGVYILTVSWNEYTSAIMFTNTDIRTIPVALESLIRQLGVQRDLLTAGGVTTIIPVCIIFFFAQRRPVEGLTVGVVKG